MREHPGVSNIQIITMVYRSTRFFTWCCIRTPSYRNITSCPLFTLIMSITPCGHGRFVFLDNVVMGQNALFCEQETVQKRVVRTEFDNYIFIMSKDV